MAIEFSAGDETVYITLEMWRLAEPREDWTDQPILAYRDPSSEACYACFSDGVQRIDAMLGPEGLSGNGYEFWGFERFARVCMPD